MVIGVVAKSEKLLFRKVSTFIHAKKYYNFLICTYKNKNKAIEWNTICTSYHTDNNITTYRERNDLGAYYRSDVFGNINVHVWRTKRP